MRINCPNCQAVLDLIEDPGLVKCPSCGSEWSDETKSYQPRSHEKIGRFALVEQLGAGAFGSVWRAHDPLLGREVALKIPREHLASEQEGELFLHEARAAAKLSHPNIVPIHEVGIHDNTPFIVSELVAGTTLAQHIRRKDADEDLGPREAAELCLTMARALHYAHECGIVHRDLKPGNIMIDATGAPRVMDFGLAKLSRGDFTITSEGQVIGTMRYMPPEQARGESHRADGRSDVYSIGVILYELLAGHAPFQGEKGTLQHRILHEEPENLAQHLSGAYKDLATICHQALAKDPARRYQSAGEFADDLQRFLNGDATLARPIGVLERTWRRARNNPVAVAAVGLALCCITLVVILSLPDAEVDPRERVILLSEPAGADVAIAPIKPDGSPDTTAIINAGAKTPCEVRLAPGFYLVEFGIKGHGFQSVYRTVPPPDVEKSMTGYHPQYAWTRLPDDAIQLEQVRIPNVQAVTQGMVLVQGGSYEVLAGPPPAQTIQVDDFYIDPTEVSVATYLAHMGQLPNSLKATDPNAQPDLPIVSVSFDLGVHFAEKAGKRLIRDEEFHFAATNGGLTRFPWGDAPLASDLWSRQPVDADTDDRSQHATPIRGLFSNVAEWTDGILLPRVPGPDSGLPPEALQAAREGARQLQAIAASSRPIRGGPKSLIEGRNVEEKDWLAGARIRSNLFKDRSFGHVGLRCARDAQPRLLWKSQRPE